MSPDSVILEIAFVRLAPKQDQLDEEFWADVDEQHIETEVRRRLNQNGIRCGLLGSNLPAGLSKLLQSSSNATAGDFQQQDSKTDSVSVKNRRLQSRAGRRGEIVTSTHNDKIDSLLVIDGELTGRSYPQGQCKLAIITLPQGDGHVRLMLTPEIHFGSVEQRWGAEEGAFRYEVGRQREVFQMLNIPATLSPGQTLMISCTSQCKGLGSQFFMEKTNGEPHKKLLLIRLAQTQYDDLFSPEDTREPLVTPGQ